MWAQGFWRGGPSKVAGGSEGPVSSPDMNELHLDGPRWWPGGRVCLALVLGGTQFPVLSDSPLRKGHLGAMT